MRKKRIWAFLLVCIVLAGNLCVAVGQAASNWPTDKNKKKLSSRSAVVMELSTGTVLYSKNIHEQHYPASITKIMTALLTLENGNLSDVIKFTEEEARIETGSSSMYCVPGEKFTVEQILYGIMLQSANEMCKAAADYVAGDLDSFVDMMNDRVAQLGLKDTHFMNPNGLHDDNHYTSAYDMACIAREAWKNKDFQKICGTRTYQVSATNKRKAREILGGQLLNHHQMINGYETRNRYEKDYVLGGKTGYTSMAHSTLVTFAEKDGMQLVAVVMKGNSPKQGEPNEYTDTTKVLDFAFEHFSKHTIANVENDIDENLFNTFGSYFNGAESPLRMSDELAVVLPKGVDKSQAKQKISYEEKDALTSGENVIGQVRYTYDGHTVGSTDIIYEELENTRQLNQSTQEVVDTEIQKIDKSKKHAVILQKLSGIKYSFYDLVSFFRSRVILIIVVALVVILIVLMVMHYRMSSRSRRRRRRSGMSRSSGGMSLNSRKSGIFGRRKRRRHGVDLTSSGRRSSSKRRNESGSSISARKMKKNRKKTKESFGKSFYDF